MPHRTPVAELQELAEAQYKRRDFAAALRSVNEALSSTVPSVRLLDTRAATYEKLGDTKLALKDAYACLKMYDDDVTGYLRAGKLLQMMGKSSAALRLYERGIDRKIKGMDSLRRMHDKLSRRVTAASAVDPLAILPLELVQMILSYLSFRQIVTCMRASKKWSTFIKTLPDLWQDLDLSEAQRPVSNAFISQCINRSKHRLRSATLARLSKVDTALHALTKRCLHLRSLTLHDAALSSRSFMQHIAQSPRLTNLTFGPRTTIRLEQVSRLLVLCPQLISLICPSVGTSGNVAQAAWNVNFPNLETLKLVRSKESSSRATRSLDIVSTHPFPICIAVDQEGQPSMIARIPNICTLVLSLWDEPPDGRNLDFSMLKRLTHLDLGTLSSQLVPANFPSSLVFLASPPRWLYTTPGGHDLAMSSLKPWDGLDFPDLQTLHCETMEQAIMILSGGASLNSEPSALGSAIWTPMQSLRILKCELACSTNVFDALSQMQSPRFESIGDLCLRGLQRVDDNWSLLITTTMPKLIRLDLSDSDVSGYGLKTLVNHLPELKLLRVERCTELSSDAIAWARSRSIQVISGMGKSENASGRSVRYE